MAKPARKRISTRPTRNNVLLLKLSDPERETLASLATDQDMSMQAVLRQALKQYQASREGGSDMGPMMKPRDLPVPLEVEKITGVAMRMADGEISALGKPARHGDVVQSLRALGYGTRVIATAELGFTTSTGRYVNRKEALSIALRAQQVVNPAGAHEVLFAENLW